MVYSQLSNLGQFPYIQQKPVVATTSPRPVQQKPAFMCQYEGEQLSLDTECSKPDVCVYPSTPPLSFSSSAGSSPGTLPTPTTGLFMGLDNIEGVKEGCEGDVQSEILAGGDWTRSCSPPLTPGKFPCATLPGLIMRNLPKKPVHESPITFFFVF